MAPTASTESTQIFRRVIDSDMGSFSQELARFVLNLDFRGEDHERYQQLSTKAQQGTLTVEEAGTLDAYLHVDSLLAILRVKGERSLRSASNAAD